MSHPKASDWKKHEELLRADTRGWNPQKRLPELLRKEYPWANDFAFGFIDKNNLAHARANGWEFLMTSAFDIESFNDAVGLRFGLTTDAAGHVMAGSNYVLIQPRDFKEKMQRKRNEEFEESFSKSMENNRFAISEDPRREEILQDESLSYSTFSEDVIEDGKPRRRGRPPKNKG